ncbi:aldehyde dehydrogenase family protein [Euzebya tangerina]|uniref:aldehyde dehydrogenase family protein n=1 Tax=Euzebya tangerina TaxID=591198 RepID=UPI000E31336B|nr:aldehyde dehydrogenase family protein [Euzebya tangerina]
MSSTDTSRVAEGQTFQSLNPATDEPLATYPVHTAADVENAVIRARAAASWWRDLGFDGRKHRLLAYKGLIARKSDELVQLIHVENGKPLDDAFIEILLCVDHLDWAARNAQRIMKPRRVSMPPLTKDHAGYLQYDPMGVVGVIGPWNYPVHTPMGSISYALAAGNAVVFKPSEYTPGIGTRMVELFAEVVDEEPVLQLITGFGETGAALCSSPGIDVLAFTGSAATGRKVMTACAQNLTKVVMECGGKDALLVDSDADIRAAAEATLWAGCANAGQTCAGVERVYIHDQVYDEFVAEITRQAEGVRAGQDAEADYGPITMPSQIEIIASHLREALDRGAHAIVGGLDSIRGAFVDPIVLTDVPADAAIMTEETFGPVVPLVRVPDMDEAVRLANASPYGLGNTVFSRRRGLALARALNSGMVSVNSVLRFASVPALPFGGRGESGFGRIHGEDGFKEFVQARAITRKRLGFAPEFASFARPDWLFTVADQLLKVTHGRHRL